MYIGVDCGTQSTKVVVFDADKQCVIGRGAVPHRIMEGDHGRREQDPHEWITAFEHALKDAVAASGIHPRQIKAISISGQQHGMVALDKHGQPVHPAKLWCDTESSAENADLIKAFGGAQECLKVLGITLQTGYTASKIAWLRRYYPEAYSRIDLILLPHDYLNFYLTGERVAEYGDASGTGYFDTRHRCWSEKAFQLIAPELDMKAVLPKLIRAEEPVGTVLPDIAERLGLSPDVIVASGGGDNMMGAIGTGNIKPGIMTASLGTSGTLYAYADAPMPDPVASDHNGSNALVANFCSSNNGWLPLICTMNVTSATTLVRNVLNLDLEAFNEAAKTAPIGAEGITILPFFNGERVPPLPEATASFEGLSSYNMSAANLSRAVMEGAIYGLRYGLDALRENGMNPTQIRLIGGGSKSPLWRQMVSDIMNLEITCPIEEEAAALGAALQAVWCDQQYRGRSVSLSSVCEGAVSVDDRRFASPVREHVEQYERVYQRYLDSVSKRYPAPEE